MKDRKQDRHAIKNFTFRIPSELREKLQSKADEQNTTLTAVMIHILEQSINQ